MISHLSESRTNLFVDGLMRNLQVIDGVSATRRRRSKEPTTLVLLRASDWPWGFRTSYVAAPASNYILVQEPPVDAQRPYVYVLRSYVRVVLNDNLGPHQPLWYREGITRLWGNLLEVQDEIRLGYLFRNELVSVRGMGLSMPISEVVKRPLVSDAELPYDPLFDDMSALLVHYVALGSRAYEKQLDDYLTRVSRGEGSEAAFERAFGVDNTRLTRELRNYAHGQSYYILKGPDFEGAKLSGLQRITCEEGYAEVALAFLSDPSVNAKNVQKWVRAAAKVNGSNPTVLAARAMSHERLREFNAADALWDELIQAPGADHRWHWLAARAWIERAKQSSQGYVAPPSSRLLAEKALVLLATSEAGKGDASTLYSYGIGALLTGTEIKSGLAAIAAASHLAPTSPELAQVAALLSERAGDKRQALQLWKTVLGFSAEPEVKAEARARIEQLAEETRRP